VVQLLDDENVRIAGWIRAVAKERSFQEAMVWQNRTAFHTAVEPLLRAPEHARDSKTRQHQQLVANYLQRYCAKNDTIGFFGPVGWAAFSPVQDVATLVPGPSLVDKRTVYFEYWAIDALATYLAEDAELRLSLAPRRRPTIRLDGDVLHHATASTRLPPQVARLVAACDGERSARSIASELVGTDFATDGDVYQLLSQLDARRVLIWTLEVPPRGAYPEKLLRATLEDVEPGQAKASALSALNQLEAARDRVAEAVGDPQALDESLRNLEATFTQLTDRPGTRHEGKSYAGRTLVYEDCRRNVRLDLGAGFLKRASDFLAPVLQVARWYTHTIAMRYREAVTRVFRELRASSGGSQIEFGLFWKQVSLLFSGPSHRATIVDAVVEDMKSRWARLLLSGPDGRRIELSRSVLTERVRAEFPAPCPGWPSARHHSPDLLIAADGLDAFVRGHYSIVLGEMHPGMNTLSSTLFVKEHATPEELIRAREVDVAAPGIGLAGTKSRTRADWYSLSRFDLDLETGEAKSGRPRAQTVSVSELVVEEDRGLCIRTRDARARFDVVQFLEHYLISDSYPEFGIMPSLPHTPRATVDGDVLVRERWVFSPEQLGFATSKDATSRYIGLRRWARTHGLPDHVFVKIPEEQKPQYVDLTSPLFAEIFSKSVRKASSIVVTEMLPGPNETWLCDAEGNRYVSELRIVAVDPQEWVPAYD